MPFRRPEDVEIQPGQTFHLPAAQEKNVQTLMEVFDSIHKIRVRQLEAATETFEAIEQIDREDWDAQTRSYREFGLFSRQGGMMSLVGGSIQRIKDQITGYVDEALAPLVNKISELADKIFTELSPALLELTNNISTVIDNVANFELKIPGMSEGINLLDMGLRALGAFMTGGIFGSLIASWKEVARLRDEYYEEMRVAYMTETYYQYNTGEYVEDVRFLQEIGAPSKIVDVRDTLY